MMSSKTGSSMDMGVKGGKSLSPSNFSVTSDMEEDGGHEGPGDTEPPAE